MFWRKKTRTPDGLLRAALAARDLPEVVRLLDAGADANAPDSRGISALALAVSEPWLEGTAALLGRGADPNALIHSPKRRLNRMPLLQLAAAGGAAGVVRSLLAAGARCDATDGFGNPVLVNAAYLGRDEVVSLLIAHGAPLDQRDRHGQTGLMLAANLGHVAVVRTLLAAGADPGATDNEGSTPIMFAAQHAHDAIVELLLEAGADPKVEGTHGFSAIRFAEQNRHASTLALLTGDRSAHPTTAADPPVVMRALRDKALEIDAADFRLTPTHQRPRVWGVLMELGLPERVVTLVAFADDEASLYFSDGGGVIGAGGRPAVRATIGPLLDAAESRFAAFTPAVDTTQPDVGRVRFYVRTFDGTLTAEADIVEVERQPHALTPLYAAGQDVLTAMRKAKLF